MEKQINEESEAQRENTALLQEENCTVYRAKNETGELTITEHKVFPGIWLVYKDAHIRKFEYPAAYPSGLLEITHCREGRFEYDAGEQFFYLGKGDLAIHESKGERAAVNCPTRHYHGISVIIDPAAAPHCLSCILEDVNVKPSMLLTKFCRENPYYIMRSTPRLEHIFSELYSVPEHMKMGYFKIKVLELLLFLSGLELDLDQMERRACSKTQVELAKRVCGFLDANMDKRFTIEQLAAQFYVSPAQLKKCFYSVYDESVYAYIRTYKMQSAAVLLRTTDQTVAEIAGAVGYDNSSKFAKAFRDIVGMSPAEYRRVDLLSSRGLGGFLEQNSNRSEWNIRGGNR